MNTTSVPKILLGLGAFCLLAAATTFLAVSWSTLGVGGRTAVLATLTLTALAGTLVLHRRGLRTAAEAMSVVTLGLLTLDVYGAAAAGLLGDPGAATVTLLAGGLLTAGAAGFGLATAGALPRLTAPQVATGVGLVLAWLGGAAAGSGHPLVAGHAVALGGGLLALRARRTGLPVAQWSCLGGAGLAWAGATLVAASDALARPTLHQMWLGGSGWALLLSALGLLLPAAVLREEAVLLAGGSGAALLATATLTLPVAGSSATTVVAVALAVTAAWSAVLALVPHRLRVVAVAPTAGGALVLGAGVLAVAGCDLLRWALVAAPYRHGLLVRLDGPRPPVAPVLVVPAMLVLALVVLLAATRRARPRLRPFAGPAALVTGAATALATAGYDLPLAISTGVLTLTGVLGAALALRRPVHAAVAVALLAAAVVASLPSAGLTAATATVAAATGIVLALLAPTAALRSVGEALVAPAAVVAATGVVTGLGLGPAWLAVPVLLVASLPALVRPVVHVEVPAAALAVLVLPVALAGTTQPLGLLSLWLLTAGALCSASALLHPSRRLLAAPGAVLLVVAVWARLADRHVEVPEAYTLPLAAALLALGVHHLHRHATARTVDALGPGLALALLPSLALSLQHPGSLRAVLLGGACLALVLAGAALRWSAPVVAGAAAGVVLVLRELGPYAHLVPQWVWIGLAGVLLTVAGITWERQLRDLRNVVGAIGRLR